MLNFPLRIVFILYVPSTFRSNCSLVFCDKVVHRLDLVHSKCIGNERIAKIRAPQ